MNDPTGDQTSDPTGDQTSDPTGDQARERAGNQSSDPSPNPRQRELIENTDGIYLVDAGAGTGKTFSITRRYVEIVEQSNVSPDDVLLATFTNNAATEMRDRIVTRSAYGARELSDAPIGTFHSLCHDLLGEYGHDAPRYLGIDDHIADSTQLVENEFVERSLFEEFIDSFIDDNPAYSGLFAAISDPTDLLDVVGELASKGIFPTADGWYRDSESHLDGEFTAFKELFDARNEPRNDGSKQSTLRAKLNRYGSATYLPEAPSKADVRGDGKQVPEEVASMVFEEDREELKSFVHDVYVEYLRFALRRNFLTFGFLQLFAFVLLCEDHALRDRIGYEYVMVDEFQDTSEIQFKLALLLADAPNLCVVGDWKQSIYSFQYADVDNIVEFEDRLEGFAADLNQDGAHDRVPFAGHLVTRIALVENYRSTQSILDFSEAGLVAPATSSEDVDAAGILENVTSLEAVTDRSNTRIEAFQSEDEHAAVLSKIADIVGNEDYCVEGEDGALRAPEYGDVAVLTRRRDFGRELLQEAESRDFPMAYEGGVEIFRTDAAKLLLAWLRVLEYDSDRGWAPLLERAGYALPEVDALLESGSIPEPMATFRNILENLETLGAVARHVFTRYGHNGPLADAILEAVQSVHDTTTLTRGDLIRFIERGIEAGTTQEVHTGAGTDTVTVQTIHATKGLEYPIVVLANMNNGSFPPAGGGTADVTYTEPVGLRQRTVYDDAAHGHAHVYRNWRSDVLTRCLPRNYDEERRLLYVAITRARSHVLCAAGAEPNAFLEALPIDIEQVVPGSTSVPTPRAESPGFRPTVERRDGPASETPHTIMQDGVFADVTDGMGVEFGSEVHEFAERYALGTTAPPRNDDERHVAAFLDGLSGTLLVEEDVHLPLTVDGEDVVITGVVDLVHVTEDRVDVVDFKTDRGRHAEPEYRKQLSVYTHVIRSAYPDHEIVPSILYTETGDHVEIEPLSESGLAEAVRAVRTS